MELMETIFSILLIGFVLLLAAIVIVPAFFGAPWHPLLPGTIRRILEFAELKSGEKIYDLGSGDGRVLIEAARRYDAQGVGIEIDPVKVWVSRRLVRCAGVADKIQILRKNFYACDVSDADVLYIYLTHQAIDKIFPAVIPRLKPSVRIVCFRFCLRGMIPVKSDREKNLYMYRLDKGTKVNEYS